MFIEGRGLAAWWSWLAGGACGVLALLLVACYCRLMPRQHKSFDEQYLKENHTIRENHAYSSRDSYRVKHAEVGVQVQRHTRPSSYAGAGASAGTGAGSGVGSGAGSCAGHSRRPPAPPRPPRLTPAPPAPRDEQAQHDHFASSTTLEEAESSEGEGRAGAWCGAEALKTRSLPAFLRPRPRPRPLSDTDAEIHLLYSKLSASKKHQSRMRSEHAAVIALSKSRGQLAPAPGRDCDAVVVYDQRTQL